MRDGPLGAPEEVQQLASLADRQIIAAEYGGIDRRKQMGKINTAVGRETTFSRTVR
jgi:hypothetical protein